MTIGSIRCRYRFCDYSSSLRSKIWVQVTRFQVEACRLRCRCRSSPHVVHRSGCFCFNAQRPKQPIEDHQLPGRSDLQAQKNTKNTRCFQASRSSSDGCGAVRNAMKRTPGPRGAGAWPSWKGFHQAGCLYLADGLMAAPTKGDKEGEDITHPSPPRQWHT